jgi:TMEM175 potassium channel family protein
MAQPGHLSDTARVEAFSDGVFAIAITLLVLEIRVPAPDATDNGRTLVAALRGLWPSYLGYVLSFVTIGIMWANHHSIFRYVRRADRYFMLINVMFLMCISFLPFPTGLLAKYLPEPGGRTVAVATYSATLVVIALAYNALWWYAAAGDRLLAPDCDRDAVRTISRRYAAGPISYGVSLGLAFVNVWASLAVHGLLAALYLLPEHPRVGRPSHS